MRERLLTELNRIPRYTCVETIRRSYYDARPGSHGSSCSALVEAHQQRRHTLRAFAWDRLRLEVAWVNDRNVFSWVGMPEFDEGNIELLTDNRPLSSGEFGILLREVLLHTRPAFGRERVLAGRRFFEYSYTMPANRSTYRIKTKGGWTQIGYHGSFLVDPEAMDLVKLRIRASHMPEASCFASNDITYARTLIHGRQVLIPQGAQLDLIDSSGTESLSEVTYGSCREYRAAVRILAETPTAQSGPQQRDLRGSETLPAVPLPPGLGFTARILTPIDSETTAIGDPVEAVTRTPIYGKDRTLIVPAGTHIYGHCTNFIWQDEPLPSYTVSLNFEWIKVEGRPVPFHAVLAPAPPKVFTPKEWSREEQPHKPDSRFGGTFFFSSKHLHITNLEARWITATAPLARNKN